MFTASSAFLASGPRGGPRNKTSSTRYRPTDWQPTDKRPSSSDVASEASVSLPILCVGPFVLEGMRRWHTSYGPGDASFEPSALLLVARVPRKFLYSPPPRLCSVAAGSGYDLLTACRHMTLLRGTCSLLPPPSYDKRSRTTGKKRRHRQRRQQGGEAQADDDVLPAMPQTTTAADTATGGDDDDDDFKTAPLPRLAKSWTPRLRLSSPIVARPLPPARQPSVPNSDAQRRRERQPHHRANKLARTHVSTAGGRDVLETTPAAAARCRRVEPRGIYAYSTVSDLPLPDQLIDPFLPCPPYAARRRGAMTRSRTSPAAAVPGLCLASVAPREVISHGLA
ncbi:hypothetical protein CDD83_5542 [Cordyceps sp. RAO-2017]|nr:hypothetical protein CDD83_5542 [Cordyceps sp. RAO-2017]